MSDHDLLYSNVEEHNGEESNNTAAFPTASSRESSRGERILNVGSAPAHAPKSKAKAKGELL